MCFLLFCFVFVLFPFVCFCFVFWDRVVRHTKSVEEFKNHTKSVLLNPCCPLLPHSIIVYPPLWPSPMILLYTHIIISKQSFFTLVALPCPLPLLYHIGIICSTIRKNFCHLALSHWDYTTAWLRTYFSTTSGYHPPRNHSPWWFDECGKLACHWGNWYFQPSQKLLLALIGRVSWSKISHWLQVAGPKSLKWFK